MTYEFIVKNFANYLYVSFLLTTYKSYSGIKRMMKKNTKQKSKNKDNSSDVQSKVDSNADGDSETIIEKAPPKTKTFFAFRDGFAKPRAGAKKWIQCTECLLWAHVECLDSETHMYVCEYYK